MTSIETHKDWYSGLITSMASQELIRFCRRFAGNRILDLGCATGDYCLELDKLGYVCVGADINETYVDAARKKGVDAVVSGEKLPFEDNSFDTVIMFEVLEHVQDPERVLREAQTRIVWQHPYHCSGLRQPGRPAGLQTDL